MHPSTQPSIRSACATVASGRSNVPPSHARPNSPEPTMQDPVAPFLGCLRLGLALLAIPLKVPERDFHGATMQFPFFLPLPERCRSLPEAEAASPAFTPFSDIHPSRHARDPPFDQRIGQPAGNGLRNSSFRLPMFGSSLRSRKNPPKARNPRNMGPAQLFPQLPSNGIAARRFACRHPSSCFGTVFPSRHGRRSGCRKPSTPRPSALHRPSAVGKDVDGQTGSRLTTEDPPTCTRARQEREPGFHSPP